MSKRTEGERLQCLMGIVSPFLHLFLRILRRIAGITSVAYAIQFIPIPVPALRAFGALIGDDTIIYPRLTIHGALNDFSNLRIGRGVRIIRDCLIDLTEAVVIDDNVILSFGCKLITHRNVHRSPLAEFYATDQKPIRIKRGAVLFTDVTVLMGVTIGECAMVAAGSVVTRNVPDWTLVGGVPARHLKNLREGRKT